MRVSWLSTPLLDDTIVPCLSTVCQLCFCVCCVTGRCRFHGVVVAESTGLEPATPYRGTTFPGRLLNRSLTFRGHDRT